MENASNALLIAGGILIAMLIISMGVVLVNSASSMEDSYEQTLDATELETFNSTFLVFEGRDDISIHEIISIANYVIDYNSDYEENEQITVKIGVIQIKKDADMKSERLVELIENNSDYTFKCTDTDISYSDNGKVSSITFSKNN